VAVELGIRGILAEVDGDAATVVGAGGLRVRVPLDRLRPDRQAPGHEQALGADGAAPGVTVRLLTQNDVPDEVDLRGRTAQEAREVVRDLVDAASLAGRAEVRVIHGRGTGAVRKAVRDELARHPLVEGAVADSADGATVVRLAGR
jgi:DNA mismatch repair protein MutS2